VGPVGSLKEPEATSDFERFEGEGFVVYVHRDTLAGAEVPGVIRFNFGSYGWCELNVGRGSEEG
jgi:hypothetical protein